MIELVSRKSVFHKLTKIGNEIHIIQKSMYDDNFSDTGYTLTEKQIIELELEFDFIEAKPVGYYDFELIRIKSKRYFKNGNIKYYRNVANDLNDLLLEAKTKNFYIISHLRKDFFNAMKVHYKVKRYRKSYSKLEEKIKVGSYNEAIKISKDELIDFLEIFNTIDTFGGGVPEYILICDENDKFCLLFHYSGQIDFWSFNKNDFLSDSVLNKYDFNKI
jgi:hypothetical protein